MYQCIRNVSVKEYQPIIIEFIKQKENLCIILLVIYWNTPLVITSKRLLATAAGVTGRDMSSTHVTYKQWADWFGYSLKRQSVFGKCEWPLIAMYRSGSIRKKNNFGFYVCNICFLAIWLINLKIICRYVGKVRVSSCIYSMWSWGKF